MHRNKDEREPLNSWEVLFLLVYKGFFREIDLSEKRTINKIPTQRKDQLLDWAKGRYSKTWARTMAR